MTRVALIACDHGLGHVRRVVLVADALHRAGAEATVLAPGGAVARVRRSSDAPDPGVRLIEFASATTPNALRSGDVRAVRWEERLPDLTGFDIVVADTLPEVLAVRPDAVLLAQFLWHDVLEDVDRAYRERAIELLSRSRRVIGSELFAMPAVRGLAGFVPVGLYGPGAPKHDGGARHDLLISGGTTGAAAEALQQVVLRLVREGPGPYRHVLVDPELVPAGAPRWVRPAEHTSGSYEGLAGAVVRPGLGLLSELLARRVPVWTVAESRNVELAFNAAVVERIGHGIDLGTVPADAVQQESWETSVVRTVLAGPRLSAGRPTLRTGGAEAAARTILT